MSSKAQRSKAQREQAIHVDASADETPNLCVPGCIHELDYLKSLNDYLGSYMEVYLLNLEYFAKILFSACPHVGDREGKPGYSL